jgi:deoxyguanosine kinase
MSHPASGLARFRHIAIEGPIGVGKTTLARLIAARIGAEAMLEQPAENPFLGRFYDDMAGYAFQTQLFFLFQRERQVRGLAQPSMFGGAVVSDFMFAKDALFARLTLSDDEYRLYAQMHRPIAAQLREPDLVVWLRAPTPTLLARVRRRGIAMERGIEPAYLERLGAAYAEFFDGYDGAPVFAVDTERFNPLDHESDLLALLDALERFEGRRGRMDARADSAFGAHGA